MLSSDRNQVLRIVLLGETDVGKTTLFLRLQDRFVPRTQQSTVAAEFGVKIYQNDDKSTVSLQMWDTAGSERYRSIIPSYFKNVSVFLVVSDVTRKDHFEKVSEWLNLVEQHTPDNARYQIVLVSNKIDLAYKRTFRKKEAQDFADRISAEYVELSALEGDGMEDLTRVLLALAATDLAHTEINNDGETGRDKKYEKVCAGKCVLM